MAATTDPQTNKRLTIAAMQNRNIKQMLDEFTSNWGDVRQRVIEQQDAQLTRISGSKHYSVVTASSSFTLGMTEKSLRIAIGLLQTSSIFEKLFINKIDQKCKFYQDSAFTFKDDVLTYTKLSYMAYDPSNTDRFAMASVQYGVKLRDIAADIKRFLTCISDFHGKENSCVLPERWTKEMWSSFESWTEEAAAVVFMANNQQRYVEIQSHLRDIGSYLPNDFLNCPFTNKYDTGADDP
uniref:Uncharacterized protein n=1 Tax=Romanomermis culicivorax TaxID=13658 RepID=A0A915L9D8_ROMCU